MAVIDLSNDQCVLLHTGTILIFGNPAFVSFKSKLQQLSRKVLKQVVIDFSNCIYIDSRAITTIIMLNRRLQLNGGLLKIKNANQEISDLLHTMQLNRIIEMV